MNTRSRFVLPTFVIGYVLLIGLWFGLRLVFFDRLWWLALVNTEARLLFLPLPLLIMAVLWRRRWHSLAALLVPLIILAHLYGALFVPRLPPRATTPTQPITVMTFNLLYSNRNNKAIKAAINAAQPDLIGLQEVVPTRARSVRQMFAATHPYMAFRVKGEYAGVGLVSRYPIRDVTYFDFPPRQGALHAVLDVNGTSVHVVVVHLSANKALKAPLDQLPVTVAAHYAEQADQVQGVLDQITNVRGPQLVVCDCNLTETSEAHALLERTLHDSFQEAGWGLGLTSRAGVFPFAVRRIDYIWHSPDVIADDAWVGVDGGSDHYPVVARLRLPVD